MNTILIEAKTRSGVLTLLQYDGTRFFVADGPSKGKMISPQLYNATLDILKDHIMQVGGTYVSHVEVK